MANTTSGDATGAIELSLDFEDSELNALFDKDIEKLKSDFNKAIANALMTVGSNMQLKLIEHIENDVYNHDVYNPVAYKRRSEDPTFGPPLTAYSNMKLLRDDTSVALEYLPSGYHKIYEWYDVDGNALIGRIERNSPRYSCDDNGDDEPETEYDADDGERKRKRKLKIPNRPFWQNFTDEMIEGGQFLKMVLWAMKAQGFDFEDNGEGVIRNSEDGKYSAFWG